MFGFISKRRSRYCSFVLNTVHSFRPGPGMLDYSGLIFVVFPIWESTACATKGHYLKYL